jgi:hypothetical protein
MTGMTVARLAGRVAGGSTGPVFAPSVLQGWLAAAQGACGRAVTRVEPWFPDGKTEVEVVRRGD